MLPLKLVAFVAQPVRGQDTGLTGVSLFPLRDQQARGQELQCHPPLREHLRGGDAHLRWGVKAAPSAPPSAPCLFQLLSGPPPPLTPLLLWTPSHRCDMSPCSSPALPASLYQSRDPSKPPPLLTPWGWGRERAPQDGLFDHHREVGASGTWPTAALAAQGKYWMEGQGV